MSSYMQGRVKMTEKMIENVGIDIAKAKFDVAIHGENVVKTYHNNLSGMKKFLKSLNGKTPERIVLEATGGYESKLVIYLQKNGLQVCVINPRVIRDFARMKNLRAKTDRLDALNIAHFAELIKPPIQKPITKNARLLKALIARRRQLIEMRKAEKNHLEHADDKFIRQSINKIIKGLNKEIEQIDKEIDELATQDKEVKRKIEILQSVPGIGQLSATIIATNLPEIGECNRQQIAALLGVAPMNRDSGTFKGKRMTGGGRKDLRTQLYMPILSAIQYNPVIRNFYNRLVNNGKPKMTAVVASMRKLFVILNSMVKKNEVWKQQIA